MYTMGTNTSSMTLFRYDNIWNLEYYVAKAFRCELSHLKRIIKW